MWWPSQNPKPCLSVTSTQILCIPQTPRIVFRTPGTMGRCHRHLSHLWAHSQGATPTARRTLLTPQSFMEQTVFSSDSPPAPKKQATRGRRGRRREHSPRSKQGGLPRGENWTRRCRRSRRQGGHEVMMEPQHRAEGAPVSPSEAGATDPVWGPGGERASEL